MDELVEHNTLRNTFSKEEKLCKTIAIDRLFTKGSSFISYPLRIVYLVEENCDNQGATVLISVSKKKFKRAVKRNRVKRLIREAYRLHKSELLEILIRNNQHSDIAFLYLKDELPTFLEIEKSMIKALSVLAEKSKEKIKE